jgi:hypothetical protein
MARKPRTVMVTRPVACPEERWTLRSLRYRRPCRLVHPRAVVRYTIRVWRARGLCRASAGSDVPRTTFRVTITRRRGAAMMRTAINGRGLIA